MNHDMNSVNHQSGLLQTAAAQKAAYADVAPPSHTEATLNNLGNLHGTLADALSRLTEVHGRMFGLAPASAQGKDGPVPVPNGKVSEIEMAIANVQQCASRIHDASCDFLRLL